MTSCCAVRFVPSIGTVLLSITPLRLLQAPPVTARGSCCTALIAALFFPVPAVVDAVTHEPRVEAVVEPEGGGAGIVQVVRTLAAPRRALRFVGAVDAVLLAVADQVQREAGVVAAPEQPLATLLAVNLVTAVVALLPAVAAVDDGEAAAARGALEVAFAAGGRGASAPDLILSVRAVVFAVAPQVRPDAAAVAAPPRARPALLALHLIVFEEAVSGAVAKEILMDTHSILPEALVKIRIARAVYLIATVSAVEPVVTALVLSVAGPVAAGHVTDATLPFGG